MSVSISAKPLAVDVFIYNPLAKLASDGLCAELVEPLKSYVSEVLAGLHINRVCSVKISIEPQRYDSLRPLRVHVDGYACTQPVQEDWSSPEFLHSLSEQLEHIVCINRELLLSDRSARDCRRAWGLSAESDGQLHEFLRRMISQGFSLATAKTWLDAGGDLSARSAFEEAVAARGCLPVRITLARDWESASAHVSEELGRRLSQLGVGAVEVISSIEGLPPDVAFRVRINDLWLPRARELERTAISALLDTIVGSVEREVACLVTPSSVQNQLDRIAERYPALHGEVVSRFPIETLIEILRTLAAEQVPIYEQRSILERVLTTNGISVASNHMQRVIFLPETAHFCLALPSRKRDALDVTKLTESVRCGLESQISEKFGLHGKLNAILLHPELEGWFADSSKLDHHLLRLLFRNASRIRADWCNQDVGASQSMRQAPASPLGWWSPGAPVLLTTSEVRPVVGAAFAKAFRDLPVLSYQELSPDLSINSIGRLDPPELSAECCKMREQLEAKDSELGSKRQAEPPADVGDNLAVQLQNMLALTLVVEKIGFRKEQLDAAKSDELREFLTEEICHIEAGPVLPEHGEQTSKLTDMGDIFADFLQSQKGSSN